MFRFGLGEMRQYVIHSRLSKLIRKALLKASETKETQIIAYLHLALVITDRVHPAQFAYFAFKKLQVSEKEKTFESNDFNVGNFFGFVIGAGVFVDVRVSDATQRTHVRSLHAVNDL